MRTYGKRASSAGASAAPSSAASAAPVDLLAQQAAAILAEADSESRKRPRSALISYAAETEVCASSMRSSSSLRASGQAAAILQELDYHLVRRLAGAGAGAGAGTGGTALRRALPPARIGC